MEQFLNNQQIPLVRVIDPNTGQQYYAPAATVYEDRNGPNPTTLKSVIVDQATSSSYALTASYALNGGSGGSGSADTGSLLTTASFSNPNLTFEKGDKSTFNVNLSSLVPTSASYAANGGVTQIIAGTNILISPSNGLGAVTINSTGGGGGTGTNTTASFSNLATWTFTHGLNSQYPIIQILNTSFEQIIPKSVTLTDVNTVTITFPTSESGYAIASLGGIGNYAATSSYSSYALSASYASQALSSSYAITASYILNAISASSSTTSITSSYPIAASGSLLYSVLPSSTSTGKNNTILLGAGAGTGTVSIYNSNYIGYGAGGSATNAYQSNFIGAYAGNEASKADNSNFIGLFTGYKAVSASFSTLIGWQAGYTTDPLTSIGTNNIIIGTNITLPSKSRDSINLGGIIFATGSYSTTSGDPYSGSQYGIGKVGINKVNPLYTFDVSGSGNYSNGLTVTGSITSTSFTGSLLGTSSYSSQALSSSNALTASYIQTAQTASYVLQAVSSSFAQTASYIQNSQTASYVTLAQTASYVLNAISSSFASTASYVTLAQTASYVLTAQTASYVLNAISSSFTSTASFVNTLNQNVLITGSLTVGTSSLGTTENTLTLGARDNGSEGGQLGLNAPGGTYTSASFIDNWQNQFRILRGTNASSNAGLVYVDLQTGNTNFVGAVTASGGYSGLPNDYLYVTRASSNQTIGSGTWADRDVIFNNTVVSKGISYNTGTGIASLTGGKVYRITARIAWSAAAVYSLQFSCYSSSNAQLGPTVEQIQSTNGTNNISDQALDFIYAPSTNADVKIRTTSGTNALTGESIRYDLNTQMIIQQIA